MPKKLGIVKKAKNPKKIKFKPKAKPKAAVSGNPYAMGDPKGYASHFGVKPPTDAWSMLVALGQIEPELQDKVMNYTHIPALKDADRVKSFRTMRKEIDPYYVMQLKLR